MVQNLVVDRIHDETERIRSIVLKAHDEAALPSFTAGAHIEFDLQEAGNRAYSLIDWGGSKNSPKEYTIAVQREEDGAGGSKAMHALVEGRVVSALGVKNDFELFASQNPVLLLAGGIGITPIISMATELVSRNAQFSFHYTGRSMSAMGFTDRLKAAFPEQLSLYCDDENPIDLDALMSAQSAETHVYICGPKGMIEAAKTAASVVGLPDENVHIELFTSPDTQSGDTPFEVEIHDTGDVYAIPVGKTIIEVLEEAGVDVMYDCQRGDCGICQTDIINGTPDHRDVVLSNADREAGKVMQICVSRARSARLVLDI